MLSAFLRGPLAQLSLTKFSRADAAKNPDPESADSRGEADHGLGPMSELQPHCGRYELKDDGNVVAWDALTSVLPAESLTVDLTKHDSSLHWTKQSDGSYFAERSYLGHKQRMDVRESSKAALPDDCRRPMPNNAQSVVIASEAL
jgi:hypothetical protein